MSQFSEPVDVPTEDFDGLHFFVWPACRVIAIRVRSFFQPPAKCGGKGQRAAPQMPGAPQGGSCRSQPRFREARPADDKPRRNPFGPSFTPSAAARPTKLSS